MTGAERETAFDPTLPAQTRAGHPVHGLECRGYSGLIELPEGRVEHHWTVEGRAYWRARKHDLDLVNVPPAAPVAQPGTEDAESDERFVERMTKQWAAPDGALGQRDIERLIALAAETTALRAAMSDAISLLQETTHGNPARSPGHNARVVLQAALAKRGLTGDRS